MLDPTRAGEPAIQQEVRVSPAGKHVAMESVVESDGEEVGASGDRGRQEEIEPEVLAVEPGQPLPIEPGFTDAVETVCPEVPAASLIAPAEVDLTAIGAEASVAPPTVLEGVVGVPAVGKVDGLVRGTVARHPPPPDAAAREAPSAVEVDSTSQRELDHRPPSYRGRHPEAIPVLPQRHQGTERFRSFSEPSQVGAMYFEVTGFPERLAG
jgi:hypothetical protein